MKLEAWSNPSTRKTTEACKYSQEGAFLINIICIAVFGFPVVFTQLYTGKYTQSTQTKIVDVLVIHGVYKQK